MEFNDIAACFEKPITVAARDLGTCTTNLKKICRTFGILRWPYRKLRSIDAQIQRLQEEDHRGASKSINELLEKKKQLVMQNFEPQVPKKKAPAKKRKPSFYDASDDDSFEGRSDSSSSSSKKHRKVDSSATDSPQEFVISEQDRKALVAIPPLPVIPLRDESLDAALNFAYSPRAAYIPSSNCSTFSFAPSALFVNAETAQPQQQQRSQSAQFPNDFVLDPLFPYSDDILGYEWLQVSAHN